MVKELGDDNGLTQDRLDQQKVVEAFNVMRDCLHEWKPDVVMVIVDDQAENFQQDNPPPFCLYTGNGVDGYPFRNMGGSNNSWDAAAGFKFTFQCPEGFSKHIRNFLIRNGIDMATSSALTGWDWGLAHAIINPLVYWTRKESSPCCRFP